MRRGYLTPPVLIGLALICIVVAGTLFFSTFLIRNARNQQIPSPSPSTSIDETANPDLIGANWKTYKDSVYKFQVQIPAIWFVYPTGGSSDGTAYPGDTFQASNWDQDDQGNYDAKGHLLSSVKNSLKVNISIGTDNEDSLEGIKENIKKDFLSENISYKYEDTIVASRKAFKILSDTPTAIVLNDKGHRFSISFYNRDNTKLGDQIFDQILSTFKFLDQAGEGEFCGGIAGISCPVGFECVLDGNYPDAGGKCVKK